MGRANIRILVKWLYAGTKDGKKKLIYFEERRIRYIEDFRKIMIQQTSRETRHGIFHKKY